MIKMLGYILTMIMGIVIGITLDRKFLGNKELNADMCFEYLRKKGYWTNVNIKPGAKNVK